MKMEKTYDPAAIESRIYDRWLENKYFHAEVNKSKKPFTIVMPPPNITGKLHMGHALDNTMQDILIRYKRMQGYEALWQPGTDHASIATEVKIIDQLKKEGIQKADLGREKFLERAWAWKEEYGGNIIRQLKKLGSSADWDRERFTMDEGCSKAVEEVFLKLHKKGYIYKGSRIINWCPVCRRPRYRMRKWSMFPRKGISGISAIPSPGGKVNTSRLQRHVPRRCWEIRQLPCIRRMSAIRILSESPAFFRLLAGRFPSLPIHT